MGDVTGSDHLCGFGEMNHTAELSSIEDSSRAAHGDMAGAHAALREVPGRWQVSDERLKEDGGSGVQPKHEHAALRLQDLGKVDVKVGALPALTAKSFRLILTLQHFCPENLTVMMHHSIHAT